MKGAHRRRSLLVSSLTVIGAACMTLVALQLAASAASDEIVAKIPAITQEGPNVFPGTISGDTSQLSLQASLNQPNGQLHESRSIPINVDGSFEVFFGSMKAGDWIVRLETFDASGQPISEMSEMVSVQPRIWTVDNAKSLPVLTRSTNFEASDADVLRLYWAFFNRQPDLAGAKYWLSSSRGGATLDDISYQFAFSAEFIAKYGLLPNDRFVELIYGNVLGRAPDPEGYGYWLNLVETGQLAKHEAVRWIAANEEFIVAHPYPDPSNDLPETVNDTSPETPKILWAQSTSIGDTYAVIEFETNECMGAMFSLAGIRDGGGGYPNTNSCWTQHIFTLGAHPASPPLLPDTEYTIDVAGVSQSGAQTESIAVHFRTLPTGLITSPSISGLSVTDITDTTARITFEADQCTGLAVKLNGVIVHSDGPPTRPERCWLSHWSVLGTEAFGTAPLVPGTDYAVEVTTYRRDGTPSPSASINFKTLGSPPGPPPTTVPPTTAPPTVPPTTAPPPTTQPPTPGRLEIVECSGKTNPEFVTIRNSGEESISLTDFALHDEEFQDDPGKGQWIKDDFTGVLAAGAEIRVESGSNSTQSTSGAVVNFFAPPSRRFIWNNERDTAFLLDGAGLLVSQRAC